RDLCACLPPYRSLLVVLLLFARPPRERALDCAEPFGKRIEMLETHRIAAPLGRDLRRQRPGVRARRVDRARHDAAYRDHDVVAYIQRVAHDGAAGDHTTPADPRAAG